MAASETHPYNLREEEKIPDGTRLLIVGTAPPPRFTKSECRNNPTCKCVRRLDFDFFYGSGESYMWKVLLQNIAKEVYHQTLFTDMMSPAERSDAARAFLRRHNIWMRDVLQTFQRKPGKSGKYCSALDNDIEEPQPEACTDFLSIFEKHTSLKTIAFTSEKAAEWTFKRLQHQQQLDETYIQVLNRLQKRLPSEVPLEEYIKLKFEKPLWRGEIARREITFFLLPSPVGRSRKKGLKVKCKQVIYRELLFS